MTNETGTVVDPVDDEALSLVVASKVRAYISRQECRTSGDFIDALNNRVADLVTDAVARCKGNQRGTVRAGDL
jgi:hypothetical protein